MRIRALCEQLGNPQKKCKFVHIGGTNGKGSTTVLTAAILQKAGYKVGVYISPYVDDFRERIQINGAMIPKDDLCDQLEKLLPCIEAVKGSGFTHPTEFEIITALALNYFAEQECDFVVFEVGLGGTHDCTNIIDAPEVACLTSISLDHTKILGNDVKTIAQDKCGIIKPGTIAVTYTDQDAEALDVIKADCQAKKVELHKAEISDINIKKIDITGSDISYGGYDLHIVMPGRHQIYNVATVIEIILALKSKGYNIPDECVKEAISTTRFNGRFEVIRNLPTCIIDGGHNPNGVEAVCAAIEELLPGKRIVTVMGMFADKNYSKCIEEIAKRSDVFIATQHELARALPARDVADVAKAYCGEVYWNENIKSAAKVALSMAGINDVILVCGSLYILHDAKEALTE